MTNNLPSQNVCVGVEPADNASQIDIRELKKLRRRRQGQRRLRNDFIFNPRISRYS